MSRQARPQNGGNGAGQNFNSTLSIVVAVVAVLVGFFILRDINSDSSNSSSSPSDDTSVDVGTTVPDAAVTTLPAATNTTGFKVLVANGSGVPGSAGDLSVALQGLGFIVQPPLNKSDATPKQTLTMVYYIAGQEANAANVAAALGGVATAPMPDPVPTETGNMGEASVLVLLATDLAGKPIAGAPAAATTTTVAG
ncbi:MAG: LytR C-terminal domain-containing protein [Actinomycetes bacterium]